MSDEVAGAGQILRGRSRSRVDGLGSRPSMPCRILRDWVGEFFDWWWKRAENGLTLS
jgi:hypothetical protein